MWIMAVYWQRHLREKAGARTGLTTSLTTLTGSLRCQAAWSEVVPPHCALL